VIRKQLMNKMFGRGEIETTKGLLGPKKRTFKWPYEGIKLRNKHGRSGRLKLKITQCGEETATKYEPNK
jgi:hypothetical protein